jgi:capsule polysaccharide export protein KpsC/LpsZ
MENIKKNLKYPNWEKSNHGILLIGNKTNEAAVTLTAAAINALCIFQSAVIPYPKTEGHTKLHTQIITWENHGDIPE